MMTNKKKGNGKLALKSEKSEKKPVKTNSLIKTNSKSGNSKQMNNKSMDNKPLKLVNKKHIFFDAGPIITLILSRLWWILPELKKQYGGSFYITPAVKFELIDRPLTIERFEFEALQVSKLIREGILEVYEDVPKEEISQLIHLANNSFKIKNNPMDIIQEGEIQSVATALKTGAEAVVMDERTLRLFIEDNRNLRSLLEKRFKTKIQVQEKLMDEFSNLLKEVKIIRSVELVSVAYKLGLLDSYLLSDSKDSKRRLLEAVLWNTKFNGAAVTEHEVQEIINTLMP